MWVNHHGMFGLIQGVDAQFLFANGFLLLLITLVPFPTAVLAAALYCGTCVVINLGKSTGKLFGSEYPQATGVSG